MKTLYRIWEFLFDRWKIEFVEEVQEKWLKRSTYMDTGIVVPGTEREFIKTIHVYRYTHKFDGSVKMVRKEV
jgi:hypothetical protein